MDRISVNLHELGDLVRSDAERDRLSTNDVIYNIIRHHYYGKAVKYIEDAHRQFRELFNESYQQVYEIKPSWNGKTNRNIHQIIKQVGVEEALFLAANYVFMNHPRHVDKCHPISHLLFDLDAVRVYTRKPEMMLRAKSFQAQLNKRVKESLTALERDEQMDDVKTQLGLLEIPHDTHSSN